MDQPGTDQPHATVEREAVCDKCQRRVRETTGAAYKIYYGTSIGLTHTSVSDAGQYRYVYSSTPYRIAGYQTVFLCHECFFAKTISRYKQNQAALFITGVIGLCVLIGIFGILLGFREHNKLVELQTAMQNNDREKLDAIIGQNYIQYHFLPKGIVAERLKRAGHSYDGFFTEGQYAKMVKDAQGS